MKHTRDVENVIALNAIRRRRVFLQLLCMINQWYVYQKCARTGYAWNWSL